MASSYLKKVAIVLIVLISVVGIFNFVVDPFGLFSGVKIKNFNAEKTEVSIYERMVKAHAIRFYSPKGIILGSSRAEYGLDPQHSAWDLSAQPVYNLALSNGRLEEVLQYLKHADTHGALEQVVFGADFFMFGEQYRVNVDYNTDRLSQNRNKGVDTGWFMDIINSLFTLDAASVSVKTLKSQGTGKAILYRPDGMRRSDETWKQVRAKGGHNAVFLADIHHDLLFPAGLATFSLSESYDKPSPTLDAFSEIVRFCLERGIELKVIISPMHAYKLEVLYHMGLWELFEYWKLRLTTIIENENQRMPSAEAAEIWDFSVYNSVTTERVPRKDEPDTQMQWYWEGSHYRREFGDKVLNCVLGSNLSNECPWGQQLNSINIVEHLVSIRDAGSNYRVTHTSDSKVLKSLIDETREARDVLRKRVGWQQSNFLSP